MIYDYLFERSDSDLFRFEMIYQLSFQNDGDKIFVHKTIFVNSLETNPRDENAPEISIFVQRFFRSS